MKIELEKVSNGWVIRVTEQRTYYADFPDIIRIARNVPDCLAELSKIMEGK